jgi:AAA15 family ATPase/GTPase
VDIEAREERIRRPATTTNAPTELTRTVYEPYFVHTGADGISAKFPLEYESHGTQRFYSLLAPVYDVFQGQGRVLVLDEFGEGMHPYLAREIVRLFQDPKANATGQLVFTTHDTSLLSGKLFRRDQVWFAEKDRSGATDLYSLHDFRESRETEEFEKGYLRGRYGAIPFFGSFDFPPTQEHNAADRSSGAISDSEADGADRN